MPLDHFVLRGGPLKRGGRRYEDGDLLEAEPADVAYLVEAGRLERFEAEEPPARAGAGGTSTNKGAPGRRARKR